MLALYNPHFETNISADTSSYGLGAVFLQKQRQSDPCWKPVAYASDPTLKPNVVIHRWKRSPSMHLGS